MYSSVRRTYSSRPRKCNPSRSSPSPSSPPVAADGKRKRSLFDCVSIDAPSPKCIKVDGMSEPKTRPPLVPPTSTATKGTRVKSKSLVQLHFAVDSTLRTCSSCSLSYTKGAIDDEILHKKHCARVRRGLEWGKEEEREAQKAGVRVIEDFVKLVGSGNATHGRIIAVPMEAGGKIGAKLASLLETINLTLSSPTLRSETLKHSKAYLFLTPSPSGLRECIAGCVIAQRIAWAMNVVPACFAGKENRERLLSVDGGLYCSPRLYPATLGVPRLFVPSAHRRRGIAKLLLTAAAKTFVHGCELDPTKGEVAFSQPTRVGRHVMENWGKGGVRIYQE